MPPFAIALGPSLTSSKARSFWRFYLAALAGILFTSGLMHAEQLPIKAWTTADGLPHNHINRILQDSRGYLWIATDEGLTRFDGRRFVNYGTAQGLPSHTVNDFLEARDGTYWVATDAGVCLFNPRGKVGPQPARSTAPLCKVYRVGQREETNHVNGLLEDPNGSLWLATSGGLFNMHRQGGEVRIDAVEIGFPAGYLGQRHVTKLHLDSRGVLWAMAISGLYRRLPEGQWERFGEEHGVQGNFVQSMGEDIRGRLWVGSRRHGLFLLASNPQAGRRIVEKAYSIQAGLPGIDVRNIVALSDGRVWLCTVGGLVLFNPEASDDAKFTSYQMSHGLTTEEIYNLTEDNDGNLWIGTRDSGVMRIASSGFVTFGLADGYTPYIHNSMREAGPGELVIYNGPNQFRRFIQHFDGKKFVKLDYQVAQSYGFAQQQAFLQDRLGEWWVATDDGLYRYPRHNRIADLARARPKSIYSRRDGLSDDAIERIFEDRRGDIWIATSLNALCLICLNRWERATNKIHQYQLKESDAPAITINALGEDAQGNLWIAFAGTGAITLYRSGQFKQYMIADGAPAGPAHAFFLDSQKRMWIGTKESGLHRVDEVTDNRLRLTTWDVSKGLASNEVWSVTEDQWGRIYAGSGRGVDRLDPATGDIRHFTSDDGLAKGEVRVSLRDRNDHLWFVTERGVSRLVPKLDRQRSSWPILITAVRVNGNPELLSELGETMIDGLSLAPDQNSVQIDFLSVDWSAGGDLRYQYRLGEQDWSSPSDLRTVNFASLRSGVYRFAVRAIGSAGIVSDPPAVVSFTIDRPLWRRRWFIAMLAASVGAAIYGMFRYRLAQALRVERVRTRIAHDLHDDIGADLTRISILSEVARQQLVNGAPPPDALLDSIAEISRQSVAAMNDIVWAVSPKHNRLLDLIRRMRRHAEEVFMTRDIKLDFQTPDSSGELKLDMEMRRDLYLIFKESVNNIARHADCSAVCIEVRSEGTKIILTVSDDGKGFDPAKMSEGHGLLSMRNRARSIGGDLVIESAPGKGARVQLTISL